MKPTTKVIIFPQETKKGFPLKLRIIDNRHPKYTGLKYFLSKSEISKYWNDKSGTLRTSYPHYAEIQKKVEEILNKQKIKIDDEESVKTYLNDRSFLKFLDDKIKALEVSGNYGSVQKLRTVQLHLKKFKSGDILFNQITIDFLNELKLYFYGLKIKPISQKGYFERIRKLLNTAIKEDKYNPAKNPFLSFEFDKAAFSPKSLTIKQIGRIEAAIRGQIKTLDLINDKETTLVLSKDTKDAGLKFLFQYYAFGMRVSDLILLQWKNFNENGERLTYSMFKTKNEIDMMVTNSLLFIIFHYLPKSSQIDITKKYNLRKNKESEVVKVVAGKEIKFNPINDWYSLIKVHIHSLSVDPISKNSYVFNMMPVKTLTDKERYHRIHNSTTQYNLSLKNLAKETLLSEELTFPLSSHTARHTFADAARLDGQSIYDISKALNHKSISTTEKYLNNFKSNQLDNKFFTNKIDGNDKTQINKKFRELLGSSDYALKTKILKILEELS